MKMLIELDHVDDKKGGKAGRLGTLIQEGIPVPRGVVYSISQNLSLKEVFAECTATLEKPFIIRSSANSEDGSVLSFAGIFESIYPVATLAQFTKAFKKIEQSLESEKLKAYAGKNNISLDTIEMHLIIQEYKKASESGVIFTESPDNKNNLLVEYSSTAGGVTDGSLPVERIEIPRTGPFPEKFKELAECALKIENLFEVPQDIEWLVSEEKIWILQSRNITVSHGSNEITKELKRLEDTFGAKPPVFVRKAFAEGIDLVTPEALRMFQKFYSNEGAYGRVMRNFGIKLKPFDPAHYVVSIFGQPFLNETLEKEFMPFVVDDSPTKILFSDHSLPKFFSLIYVQTLLRIKLYREYSRLPKSFDGLKTEQTVEFLDTYLVPKLFTYAIFQEYLYSFLKDRVKKKIQENEWNDFIVGKNREAIISRFPDTWSKEIISLHAEMYDGYSNARETLHKVFVKLLEDVATSQKTSPQISLPSRIEISSWEELLTPQKIAEGDIEGQILSYGFAQGILGTKEMLDRDEKVDILISPTIDPSLVEYFSRIKGVVTETGGELSHAAILAREYGIPMLRVSGNLAGHISKKASISGNLLHFS
ncbi:MAG: PEP/pyruvate-binding domain-containing protein [Patescibacteria group bacterium]